jgi:hypothetical protein
VIDRENWATLRIQEVFRVKWWKQWKFYCEVHFPYYAFHANDFDAKKFTGFTPFDCGARELRPLRFYPSIFETPSGPKPRPAFHYGHSEASRHANTEEYLHHVHVCTESTPTLLEHLLPAFSDFGCKRRRLDDSPDVSDDFAEESDDSPDVSDESAEESDADERVYPSRIPSGESTDEEEEEEFVWKAEGPHYPKHATMTTNENPGHSPLFHEEQLWPLFHASFVTPVSVHIPRDEEEDLDCSVSSPCQTCCHDRGCPTHVDCHHRHNIPEDCPCGTCAAHDAAVWG